ncbi:MAG TPA: hypothetical protein VIV66_11210 [Pyrinomonadaceae bacterium]
MKPDDFLRLSLLLLILCLSVSSAAAQTNSFTYQGQLTDGSLPANGTYDLQFGLFDAVTGGTQQGSTLTRTGVQVNGGIFTVQLDFGVNAFPGADRFLGIAVRHNSGDPFTTLSPRQAVTSTPYAIRSANSTLADNATNATQLGGVAASGYVQTNDARLSDARAPTAGSSNYIQNGTSLQAGSNFNISGNGTTGGTLSGNIVNATTQYNIGSARVLSVAGTNNLFAGVSAGQANTTGVNNAFFGTNAGNANTTGLFNSFYGSGAGSNNTTGGANSFFGLSAGASNTTGVNNSFFGKGAGSANTTANANSFFGVNSGASNITGTGNTFFGFDAGFTNTTASNNSFFGFFAGGSNTTAGNNSFFGTSAGFQNTEGINNSFFGFNAGFLNTTGFSNVFAGDGSGVANTTGFNNTFFGSGAGSNNTTGSDNTYIGFQSDGSAGLTNATAIGANADVTQSNSLVLGSINGTNGASSDTNVGIGTTAPNARLQVTSGDVYVQTQGKGIILRATNGSNCFRVTVSTLGILATAPVTCP